MSSRPTSVTLRSYQVGFGDCFLLSFHYGEEEGAEARHVLIDFGTTGLPPKGLSLAQIARQIESACGGKLHAVVATHRHADHISGFAGEAGRVIQKLSPELVLQPWTEHPDVPEDAPEIPAHLREAAKLRDLLEQMHEVAQSALSEIGKLNHALKTTAKQLEFLGRTNLPNQAAIKTLQELKCRHVYAAHGDASGLEEILPGVKVRVLGPPTLAQSQSIRRERGKDPSEFWHLQAMASERSAAPGKPLFPDAPPLLPGEYPDNTRWFIPRLEALRGDQLLEIVRILDEAMNNTSLILLFEVGNRKLLFPGDAQIESWEYALKAAEDREEISALLAGVDVYKVGHHGSLNATPKTLWNLFEKKGDKARTDRLVTLLSTQAGKHGSKDRGTEVPCKKLEAALQEHSTLYSTQSLKSKKTPCHEVRIAVG